MNIGIVGTGYVGLVTGVCLAKMGHRVTCLDTRPEVIANLNQGKSPIYEQHLEELLQEVLGRKLFRAHVASPENLIDNPVVMIAVGTPSSEGQLDLSQVQAASILVATYLRTAPFVSVIVKSTVLPQTTDGFVRNILEKHSGKKLGVDFGLGMNPEFLREGTAIQDFMHPDRLVLGYEDERTLGLLREIYSGFQCDKIICNSRTAEMIKYANNCLLATQISAVNELSRAAEAVGDIDMMDVWKGVTADRRWSPILDSGVRVRPGILNYLIPGCGFGGSCFPKDVQAMRSFLQERTGRADLLQAVLDVNEQQPLQTILTLQRKLGSLRGKTGLILGLSFKPGTDDVRESASLKMLETLLKQGANMLAHDPIAIEPARRVCPGNWRYEPDWKKLAQEVDFVLLATPWAEYLELKTMPIKMLLDPRRALD